MIKRSNLSATLYLLIVFISGMVVGAFAHRLYTMNSVSANTARTPEEWRAKYVGDMTRRLGLNTPQVGALQKILDETRQRYRQLHDKSKPEMKAIQDEQTQKIRAILDERQQAEYEKMRLEREHERERSGRH
ncbi:MAG: hypothetical protein M1541_17300 [Acidobacteria bacterium]|nr:hypothetical protein [Acidobacteriota bacterium]